MAGPTWDETTEDAPSWDDTSEPTWDDTTEESEPGGYEGFARKALPVMQGVMSAPERYIAAPTRAGIMEAGKSYEGPQDWVGDDFARGFMDQFGEDPTKAPTAGKILESAGVNLPSVDFPTPFKNPDGTRMRANTKNIGEGVASAAMDPTMYMAPNLGPMIKGAGRMATGAAEGIAKKGARIIADVPEAATARYIRNPEAVNKAPLSMQPHVDKWGKMTDDLENEIYSGSAASRAALEGQKFGRQDIASVFADVKNQIIREAEGVIDPEIQRRLTALETMEKAYGPQAAKSVATGKLNLDGTPAMRMEKQGPDDLSGNRVKNLVQSLQRGSDFKQRAGDFIGVADIDKNKVMNQLNARLKGNPQYEEIMRAVAADMKLMEQARGIGGTDSALGGVFRNIGKDAKESQAATIQQVDKRLGTNFHDELLDTTARRAFENTNPNGSRRTLMGAGAGAPLASMALYQQNPILAAVIQATATGAGFAADKYGGKMAKGAINASMFIPKQAKRVAEFAGERLPRDSKYFKMLMTAINKSPKELVVTHHLLMSSDPEYRAYFAD